MGKHESTPRAKAMELMHDAGYRQTWVSDEAGVLISAWHAAGGLLPIIIVERGESVEFHCKWGSGSTWQSLEDWLRAGRERKGNYGGRDTDRDTAA